jgi:broad-specificity NMP kinase
MENKRYERALIRNLHEIGRAIFERRAMVGMESAKTSHAVDFFRLAYDALFNDMVAHIIKATDRHRESASFWYVLRCDEKTVYSYMAYKGYDLRKMEITSDKLKMIRDMTHFHIDKKSVFSPQEVWKKAKLTGRELSEFMDTIWDILNHVHEKIFGKKFIFPTYDGSDAAKILKLVKKEGLGSLLSG